VDPVQWFQLALKSLRGIKLARHAEGFDTIGQIHSGYHSDHSRCISRSGNVKTANSGVGLRATNEYSFKRAWNIQVR
jgi:hypothetical protein